MASVGHPADAVRVYCVTDGCNASSLRLAARLTGLNLLPCPASHADGDDDVGLPAPGELHASFSAQAHARFLYCRTLDWFLLVACLLTTPGSSNRRTS